MDVTDPTNTWIRHVEAEHRHLCRIIHDLRRAFNAPYDKARIAATVRETKGALSDLRDELRKHFALEEEGGYMEEAVARLPSISHDADTLLAEHPSLLAAVDTLISRLDAQSSNEEAWEHRRDEFGRFAQAMMTHETNENWLLKLGFNQAWDGEE